MPVPVFFQIMLKIMLVFESYASFSKVCLQNTQNKSKIIYLLLIKHDNFFILSYSVALIKHD